MKSYKEEHIFKTEKEIKQLLRSLAIYNRRAYKQIIFIDNFRELNWKLVDGITYKAELYTDRLFEKVYGKCYVVADIKDHNYMIKEIQPKEILLAGYRKILNTYKGIPYRDNKDLIKIKMAEGIIYGKN